MFPQKISQNIDILARIHGNVFPWQPTIMGNKASYYKSIFQISLPWLYLSFHNACPRHLKSRRDLLYLSYIQRGRLLALFLYKYLGSFKNYHKSLWWRLLLNGLNQILIFKKGRIDITYEENHTYIMTRRAKNFRLF